MPGLGSAIARYADKGSVSRLLPAPTVVSFIWTIKRYEALKIHYLIYSKWLPNFQDYHIHQGYTF